MRACGSREHLAAGVRGRSEKIQTSPRGLHASRAAPVRAARLEVALTLVPAHQLAYACAVCALRWPGVRNHSETVLVAPSALHQRVVLPTRTPRFSTWTACPTQPRCGVLDPGQVQTRCIGRTDRMQMKHQTGTTRTQLWASASACSWWWRSKTDDTEESPEPGAPGSQHQETLLAHHVAPAALWPHTSLSEPEAVRKGAVVRTPHIAIHRAAKGEPLARAAALWQGQRPQASRWLVVDGGIDTTTGSSPSTSDVCVRPSAHETQQSAKGPAEPARVCRLLYDHKAMVTKAAVCRTAVRLSGSPADALRRSSLSTLTIER